LESIHQLPNADVDASPPNVCKVGRTGKPPFGIENDLADLRSSGLIAPRNDLSGGQSRTAGSEDEISRSGGSFSQVAYLLWEQRVSAEFDTPAQLLSRA
jgi:hypothetical protein